MSFQLIRSHIETRVNAAFQAARVPVIFDNTLETPPALPYVICLINFQDVTEPVICQEETYLENITGSVQISCYAARGQGMKPLEQLAAVAMTCFNQMYVWGAPEANVKMGRINGPIPVLAGTEPYALMTLSAPFTGVVY